MYIVTILFQWWYFQLLHIIVKNLQMESNLKYMLHYLSACTKFHHVAPCRTMLAEFILGAGQLKNPLKQHRLICSYVLLTKIGRWLWTERN